MYLCIFIAQPHTHVLKPHLEPGSEEGIIEMLGECEQKLVSLVEELGSRDLDTIQKEMEDEEVIDNLSQCSPVYMYVHVPNLLCHCNTSLLYIIIIIMACHKNDYFLHYNVLYMYACTMYILHYVLKS